jgi:hypothetical protein
MDVVDEKVRTSFCLGSFLSGMTVALIAYGLLHQSNDNSSSSSSSGGKKVGESSSTAPTTTNGRSKARGEAAFVLAVQLQFNKASDAVGLVQDWKAVADHCYVNEPFLFHYEVAQSDKDPLKYVHVAFAEGGCRLWLTWIWGGGSSYLAAVPQLMERIPPPLSLSLSSFSLSLCPLTNICADTSFMNGTVPKRIIWRRTSPLVLFCHSVQR